jgi:hypothetical protein
MRIGKFAFDLNVTSKIRLSIGILIIPIIILPILPPYSDAAVFDVTNEGELRQALSDSASNSEDDTINIAPGEYFTNGEILTYSTEEDSSLTIEGQAGDSTILSGGGQSRVLEITNQTTNSSEATLIIRNLTISGGSESEPPYVVAGFKVTGFKDITIENCTVGGNLSELGDGGFSISGQNVTFSNNSVSGNLTRGGFIGGGSISGSQVMLVNNRFGGNTAEKGPGGASISGETVTLIDNEFAGNVARDDVGGARISGNSINLKNNRFSGNHGVLLGPGGAAMAIGNGGQASLINNIFENNTSGGPGGGLDIFVSAQAEPIDETTVLTLTNNTFTLDSAEGTSIYEGNGGGVYIAGDDNTIINIYNNIIFDNFAANGGDDIFVDDYRVGDSIGSTVNLFNNDFSDFISLCENTEGCEPNIREGDNIDEDPLFEDAEAEDLSLQPDSPCIDAGDPDAPDAPSRDFFGNPRVPPPDMGAVEFIPTVVDLHGGGGCTLAHTPVTSSLAVVLALPVLILIRRMVKRYRSY